MFEKVDWVMSDEIEDEAVEDLTEEYLGEPRKRLSLVLLLETMLATALLCREEFLQTGKGQISWRFFLMKCYPRTFSSNRSLQIYLD